MLDSIFIILWYEINIYKYIDDVNILLKKLNKQALNGIDVKSIVGNVGIGSSAPSGGVTAPSGENNEEVKKEEAKEESEEESDDDMGFGLFD